LKGFRSDVTVKFFEQREVGRGILARKERKEAQSSQSCLKPAP